MIHRALFGSVERFFAVLRRALRRSVPGVARPRCRCVLLPVADAHAAYAHECAGRTAGPRASGSTWSTPTTPLGNRIRRAKGEKLPYVLVVGDDDVAARTVGVNPRGGEVERDVRFESFVERLAADVASKK